MSLYNGYHSSILRGVSISDSTPQVIYGTDGEQLVSSSCSPSSHSFTGLHRVSQLWVLPGQLRIHLQNTTLSQHCSDSGQHRAPTVALGQPNSLRISPTRGKEKDPVFQGWGQP